ncbi:MAG: succinate dehydrogenase, cytochrome b556 subunit [Gammaproteobacteria bacterium]
MAEKNSRPLSPHLQIYKMPLTGILSITHRLTGIALSAGLIFLVYLLSVLANGPESYSAMQSIMGSGMLRALYWLFIYALFFHLCHGIRHLIWDSGQSFERDTMNRYAITEIVASLALTLSTFILLK